MKDLDLDRSVWLMLFCFPSDAKNQVSLVDKSLASFGQLIHVHNSSTMSRLIVRVRVNKDNDVLDNVTLSVGTYPHAHTWTVLVFLLNANDVFLRGDEEPILVWVQWVLTLVVRLIKGLLAMSTQKMLMEMLLVMWTSKMLKRMRRLLVMS